jgi:hypothetical protein
MPVPNTNLPWIFGGDVTQFLLTVLNPFSTPIPNQPVNLSPYSSVAFVFSGPPGSGVQFISTATLPNGGVDGVATVTTAPGQTGTAFGNWNIQVIGYGPGGVEYQHSSLFTVEVLQPLG